MTKGTVRVTVQTAERMKAITELAQAINKVAGVLAATPYVHITDCCFEGQGTAIMVDTAKEITKTTIEKL